MHRARKAFVYDIHRQYIQIVATPSIDSIGEYQIVVRGTMTFRGRFRESSRNTVITYVCIKIIFDMKTNVIYEEFLCYYFK
jgi:hypothetical protein